MKDFLKGLKGGIPIGLGYFSVSFWFGILACSKGLGALLALLMAATNLTSAGQAAGLEIICRNITEAGAVLLSAAAVSEMAITQLVINLRYSLMGLSISQKMSPRFGTLHRLAASAFITDEIYAVASSKKGEIEPRYWYGLSVVPYFSWALGTVSGALAGDVLPGALGDALGISLYGMFLAIVVPPARDSKAVAFTAVLASVLSCLMYYLPVFSFIGSGFRVIICAVISAALAAFIFSRGEEAEKEEA